MDGPSPTHTCRTLYTSSCSHSSDCTEGSPNPPSLCPGPSARFYHEPPPPPLAEYGCCGCNDDTLDLRRVTDVSHHACIPCCCYPCYRGKVEPPNHYQILSTLSKPPLPPRWGETLLGR